MNSLNIYTDTSSTVWMEIFSRYNQPNPKKNRGQFSITLVFYGLATYVSELFQILLDIYQNLGLQKSSPRKKFILRTSAYHAVFYRKNQISPYLSSMPSYHQLESLQVSPQ